MAQQFLEYGNQMANAVRLNAQNSLHFYQTWSLQITTLAAATNQSWPYVTVPYFESQARQSMKTNSKSNNNTAKKEIESLEADHKANETKIASAKEALQGLPDPDVLVPKIKRMNAQLSEANSGIALEKSKLANLTRNDKNAQARIDHLRNLIQLNTTGKSYPTLNTRISSVYRNWGFVILAAGDSQGVITGSTLDVIRGGEVIGKLKVTAVEAGRAAADIVLDSVAEGTSLRPGDKVVAEKEKAAAPAPASD